MDCGGQRRQPGGRYRVVVVFISVLLGGSGQARVVHGLVEGDAGAQVGGDGLFPFRDGLCPLQHLFGVVAGDDDDAGLVGEDQVALVDRDVAERDRFAGGALLQSAAGGARDPPRAKTGKPSSRASSTSRQTPSATTPRTPLRSRRG